jgi:Fe-S cluster biogenesis protein NfuA
MPELESKIKASIETIRYVFQRDGGDISFVRFVPDSGTVEVALSGMCRGCGMSEFSINIIVREQLQTLFPEVKSVVAVDLPAA